MALILPYPPSVNHYWRRVGARTLISKAGRQYIQDVRLEVLAARCRAWPSERLAVTIRLWAPDKRKRDIDNTAKAILDSLAKAYVFGDDEQIDRLEIERCGVCGRGRAEVTIAEYVR